MHGAEKNSALELLVLSVLGAEVTAIVFVVVLTYTLPPSGGAYGQYPFQDSLVFPIMSMFAVVCGLLTFPFALWLLRRVSLGRSSVVIVLSAVAAVVVVTPFFRLFAVPCAFAAALGAMFFCKRRYSIPYDRATNKQMQADGPRGRR